MIETPDVGVVVEYQAGRVFAFDFDAAEVDTVAEAPALDLETFSVLKRKSRKTCARVNLSPTKYAVTK